MLFKGIWSNCLHFLPSKINSYYLPLTHASIISHVHNITIIHT